MLALHRRKSMVCTDSWFDAPAAAAACTVSSAGDATAAMPHLYCYDTWLTGAYLALICGASPCIVLCWTL